MYVFKIAYVCQVYLHGVTQQVVSASSSSFSYKLGVTEIDRSIEKSLIVQISCDVLKCMLELLRGGLRVSLPLVKVSENL